MKVVLKIIYPLSKKLSFSPINQDLSEVGPTETPTGTFQEQETNPILTITVVFDKYIHLDDYL
jgi:hypothetical protein